SCTSTSAWVKKRKICVKRLRSWGESFCAQSRQSSPSGTSSGIQWICCWRFQYSNAQGYSNGLYCLRASRGGIVVTPLEFDRVDPCGDHTKADQGSDDPTDRRVDEYEIGGAARARRISIGGLQFAAFNAIG